MIVSEALGYVFVSVPKCGSQTLFKVLVESFKGKRVGGMHHNAVPDSALDFYCFTVIRNPYDRAVSIWWSTTQRPERRNDDRYGLRKASSDPDNFETWALEVMAGVRPAPHVGRVLLRSQQEQLRGVRLDRLLKLEDLEHSFRLLPFVCDPSFKLPTINATSTRRKPWEVDKSAKIVRAQPGEVIDIEPRKQYTAYVTNAARQVVQEVYRSDFELGGYEL